MKMVVVLRSPQVVYDLREKVSSLFSVGFEGVFPPKDEQCEQTVRAYPKRIGQDMT
jgi:hypothetical protein